MLTLRVSRFFVLYMDIKAVCETISEMELCGSIIQFRGTDPANHIMKCYRITNVKKIKRTR